MESNRELLVRGGELVSYFPDGSVEAIIIKSILALALKGDAAEGLVDTLGRISICQESSSGSYGHKPTFESAIAREALAAYAEAIKEEK